MTLVRALAVAALAAASGFLFSVLTAQPSTGESGKPERAHQVWAASWANRPASVPRNHGKSHGSCRGRSDGGQRRP